MDYQDLLSLNARQVWVPWVSITPGSFSLTATDLSGMVKVPTLKLGIYCEV